MNAQMNANPTDAHLSRYLGALASLLVGIGFLALWFWLLPRWLDFDVNLSGVNAWRWLAAGCCWILGFDREEYPEHTKLREMPDRHGRLSVYWSLFTFLLA